MEIYLNKFDINKILNFRFREIKSFDELLTSDLDSVIYMSQDTGNGCSHGILGQKIVKKKYKFCEHIYFKLNNSVMDSTEINRDNFHTCEYKFYKINTYLD